MECHGDAIDMRLTQSTWLYLMVIKKSKRSFYQSAPEGDHIGIAVERRETFVCGLMGDGERLLILESVLESGEYVLKFPRFDKLCEPFVFKIFSAHPVQIRRNAALQQSVLSSHNFELLIRAADFKVTPTTITDFLQLYQFECGVSGSMIFAVKQGANKLEEPLELRIEVTPYSSESEFRSFGSFRFETSGEAKIVFIGLIKCLKGDCKVAVDIDVVPLSFTEKRRRIG